MSDESSAATMEKPKKKAASKKAAPKATKKAAPKKAAAKREPRERDPNALSPNQISILQLLSKAKHPMTRAQMKEKTDIQKGYSKLLGAATKEDGAGSETGLEPRGLVKCHAPKEGEGRGHTYEITAAGRKALEKAE